MQVLQSQEHTRYEEFGLLLVEFLMLGQMIPQIATLHQIYDQIQIFSVHKRIIHVYE